MEVRATSRASEHRVDDPGLPTPPVRTPVVRVGRPSRVEAPRLHTVEFGKVPAGLCNQSMQHRPSNAGHHSRRDRDTSQRKRSRLSTVPVLSSEL